MSDWIIYSIGFLAQFLFSGRMIYQWIFSEKAKKVIAPRFFWQVSLFASFLLFVYGYLRNDFSIMLGQSVTYFIYIRNMHMVGNWKEFSKISRFFLLIFPAIIVIYYYNNNLMDVSNLLNNQSISKPLLILGIAGQLLFTFRFIYQWIYSENKKKSSLPLGFWLISLLGSGLILIYGGLRYDPVLIVGHFFGIVIYLRNIKILRNAN
jgi:lipid-A-disaccharide synthase-like uncharacterized protein